MKGPQEMPAPTYDTNGAYEAPPIDLRRPSRIDAATFAMGCFSEAEAAFGGIDGVIRTRVGFTGGTEPFPLFDDPGDHSEAVQIVFDPERISYEELLYVFWLCHLPSDDAPPRHRSAVFTHDTRQHYLAEESIAWQEALSGETVATSVRLAGGFYEASAKYQKRFLREHPELLGEVLRSIGGEHALSLSTTATRVNCYLSGKAPANDIRANLEVLGLSAAGKDELLRLARVRSRQSQDA